MYNSYISMYPFTYQSMNRCIDIFLTCLSIYLSICLSIDLTICLSIYPSISYNGGVYPLSLVVWSENVLLLSHILGYQHIVLASCSESKSCPQNLHNSYLLSRISFANSIKAPSQPPLLPPLSPCQQTLHLIFPLKSLYQKSNSKSQLLSEN